MKIIDEKRKMNERVNVLWLIYIYILKEGQFDHNYI